MKRILIIVAFIGSFCFGDQLITPIPQKKDYDSKKALLGEKLFHDPRLSRDNTIACANCHIIALGGSDNSKVSLGIDGKRGTRNSPTVLNSRFNVKQFWDGRANTLKDQVPGPIHNPVEMGSDFPQIISKLKTDPYYFKTFNLLYQSGITSENITDAIVEYEKSLTTPNSRFDKYLRGDKKALTKDELEGFKIFNDYGCISCHNGVNIGGNLIQKLGATESYLTKDKGRFEVTKNDDDKYYFKVPTLRNIELTAPYLHDGSIATLQEVVTLMATFQLGTPINDNEVKKIVMFLKTLTGELPNEKKR